MSIKLSIVIFAHNEAESLRTFLPEVLALPTVQAGTTELVFVDDASTDGTDQVMMAFAKQAKAHRFEAHSQRRGIGGALKTGFRVARGTWVTFLPGDGQIEATVAERLLLQANEHDNALMVTTRYVNRDDGLIRKVQSVGVRLLLRLVAGDWVRSEGPYVFRRELFDATQLPCDSFFLNYEFPLRTRAAGLGVHQTWVPCRSRLAGRSKSSNWRTVWSVASDLAAFQRRQLQHALRVNLGFR